MSEQIVKTRWQRRLLYLAVLTGGMTTLAVEISASRLLGSVFGTSNIVWANIIGLILIYLTAGYFIGGRVADRWPTPLMFYTLITWAAFFSGLIPLIARPILRLAAQAVQDFDAAVTVGSFLSVLVLFAVPVTLLGFISPFALRLALTTVADSGRTAGQMYAISTLGSIIGNFTPVLWLIPQIGTTRTFLVFAGLLMLVGLAGVATQNRRAAFKLLWMPVLLLLLTVIALRGPLRPPPSGMTLLYEDESAYNLIQVVEDEDGYRYLLLNEGQGIHSQWHPTEIYFRRTWGFFLAAPYFNAPPFGPERVQRIAIIGLAAGTIARQHEAVYPGLSMDGIEIDPGIVEAGRQYMGMTMPNLNVVVEDGRFGLSRLADDYTMIGIDAYRVPYVPWHLTTVEFFREVRKHLAPDGVLAINVGRTQTDRHLVEAMTRTLLDVFPSVHTLDVPEAYNTILVGTRQPTTSANLAANIAALRPDASPVLRAALTDAWGALVPSVASDTRFTDDRASVEMMVDKMVIEFLLEGGIHELAH